MEVTLTPLQRFFLAFVAFFAVLFNRSFAEEVKAVRDRQRGALPPAPRPTSTGVGTSEAEATVSPPVAAGPSAAIGGGAAGAPAATATVPAEVVREAAPPPPPAPAPKPVAVPAPAPEGVEALHLLALLQRDGRLVDFIAEDLNGFSDAEIGAAARTVHEGCRKVIRTYVDLEPVFREPEGASVTVAPGFDASAVRLTGNVVGAPPFRGSLRHHGWRVTRAAFPPVPKTQDAARILAPAEVEL